MIVIKHLYIERRMTPLNMYLQHGHAGRSARVRWRDYGDALRQLAAVNIFAGDLLFKNFGVTRYGRVVFYDYDEIEYMTACNFRRIPAPPPGHDEMSNEVWYPVGANDIFPEEFATFLLPDPELRAEFRKVHGDLLDAAWWQAMQKTLADGDLPEVLSYPDSARFSHVPGRPPSRAASGIAAEAPASQLQRS